MSNNKQSSVIWFAIESWKLGMQLQNQEISKDKHSVLWVDLLVKAKAMHKKEIFQSYNEGYSAEMNNIPSCKCGLPKFGEYTCSRTDCDQNL